MLSMIVAIMTGTATFYSDAFNKRRTANGEIFSQKKLTAAHMRLRFGSRVRITNPYTKKSVVVKINDRGNFDKRNFDLSKEAFRQIGDLRSGRIDVQYEVLK